MLPWILQIVFYTARKVVVHDGWKGLTGTYSCKKKSLVASEISYWCPPTPSTCFVFLEPLHAGSFTNPHDNFTDSLNLLHSRVVIYRTMEVAFQLSIDLRSQLWSRDKGCCNPTSCGIKPASRT